MIRGEHQSFSMTKAMSLGFSLLAFGFLGCMVGLFLWQSLPVWQHEGVLGYLFGTEWFYRADRFGILSMVYGTLAVSVIAVLLATPIGIGAALFTAEILPASLRRGVKLTIELLAGIPSVVYGLLGILFLRNWIYTLLEPFDPITGDTLLTAGILLGIMILPTVMTLSEDAIRGVSASYRDAARGLGLTSFETVRSGILPIAKPGIVAAILLGLGRALGETIAVFLVVGRQDNQLPESLFSLRPIIEPGQTLTSKLGGSETHLAYGNPLHWAAIAGLGLVLLTIVAAVTWLGGRLAEERHYNE